MKTYPIECAYCGATKQMKRGAKVCSTECRNGLKLLPRASDRALADELTRRRLPVEGTPLTALFPHGLSARIGRDSLVDLTPTDAPLPTAVGQSGVIWPDDVPEPRPAHEANLPLMGPDDPRRKALQDLG